MRLSINDLTDRLPRRLPVGAKFVVEGFGGAGGNLCVIARYVVLPGGQRINVPADISRALPRALAFRRRSDPKRVAKGRTEPTKKIAAGRGTGGGGRR